MSRAVLKAKCKSCGEEHPRTLFAEDGVCLFCHQQKSEAAEQTAEQNHIEEEQRRRAQFESRIEMREEMQKLRYRRKVKEQTDSEEDSQFDPQSAAQQEIARRLLSRKHLLPFVCRSNPDYDPGWVHKDICEHLEWFSEAVGAGESPRLAIFMPPRHGKQLADSTPVLTTQGWTTHGELQVGDYVFHPSGEPIRVKALSDKTQSDWLVTFNNGETIRCHGNHEWAIYDRSACEHRTVETLWLARTTKFGKQVQLLTGNRSKYQLPRVEPLVFSGSSELGMDPYTLGAWLGDGSRTKPCITHDYHDQPVIDRIEQAGYSVSAQCVHATTGVVTTYFSGPRPNVSGRMTTELGEFGLRVGNNEGYKFIPEPFLRAGTKQRLELLAGLMDTDGHCDPSGRCRFTTADWSLAEGVLDLCTTLGFRPYYQMVDPTLSSSGIQGQKPYYVVGFQPTCAIPCQLARKHPQRFADQRRIGIVAVEYAPNGEQGHCIEVEAEDGLYLVGERLIPTHNSELASVNFPAWHLGNRPKDEIISCSYSSALALSFSRKVRALARDERFRQVFEDFSLDTETQSAELWATKAGGSYRAAGVGGPITGSGANVLIIDDPVKNREEAESETTRQGVWDWYTSTAYTRLQPGGGVLLILTRWHDDDLAGRLMQAMVDDEGDQWRVINYPAIAEHDELFRKTGEALHSSRYPLNDLLRIKNVIGPRDWAALYQQNPVPDQGAYFTKNMIQRYKQDELPDWDEMLFYTAWDLAVGQKEMNDWSVGVTVGVDREDNIYVVDIQRGRWDTLTLVEKILDVYQVWHSGLTGIERGQIELAVGPLLSKRARERELAGFTHEPLKPGKMDKVARARSIQGRMSQGRVFFRQHCDTTQTLVNEMLRFPNGVHDDGVDALAYIGKLLDDFATPRKKKEAPRKSWKDKLPLSGRAGRKGFMAA